MNSGITQSKTSSKDRRQETNMFLNRLVLERRWAAIVSVASRND